MLQNLRGFCRAGNVLKSILSVLTNVLRIPLKNHRLRTRTLQNRHPGSNYKQYNLQIRNVSSRSGMSSSQNRSAVLRDMP
jgi:hypothetical protein